MRRASRISSAGPHSIEPIGAPSPLERQNIIVSTCEVHAVTGSPVAAAAFQTRAPSMWIGTPAPSVIARTARSSSEGRIVPPEPPTVFSTARRSMTSTSK